jgi:RNA polymerase sigma-54 factor
MDSADTQSFYDQMMEQVAGCSLSEHDRQILEYLIGNLGDDGLLAKPLFQIADELSIYHYLDTTPEEVERVLHTLWRFDPPGVGARNLQECLIIQCKRRGYRSVPGHTPLLLKVLERNWEEISHNRWDLIQQRYKLSDQQVGLLRHEIRRLNPRPGSSMGEKTSSTETHITPDVIVSIDQDGGIELTLNEGDMPTLSVSDDAMQMIDDDFVRDCVNRGKLFIGAIKQRRHTIMRTMQAIIKLQRKYLLTGDETQLRPMRLEDIAKVTEQDLSTVSRVCNSKYVETPYGTYPLRWFFTTQARTIENEDVSVRRIHQALREVIEQEDKSAPLKDEELVGLLQQQGFDVSRRTVAKYRNQLGIPTRNMRRGVFSDNH